MCLNKCVSTIHANYVPTRDILLYKHMYGHLCSFCGDFRTVLSRLMMFFRSLLTIMLRDWTKEDRMVLFAKLVFLDGLPF